MPKCEYHIVRGDLNIDEIVKTNDDPFEWFPELRPMFEHFDIKSMDIEIEIPNESNKNIKRIYYRIKK